MITAFELSHNVNDFEKRVYDVATEPLIDSRQPTPPGPSEEEQFIEDRYLEILARQDLEADGCPPCYPPDFQIPLRDIPKEYQKIISYWQFFSDNDNHELLAQSRNWKRFRDYQKRVRQYYEQTKRPFSEYVDSIRERRQKNGLEGDVRLRFNLEENDRGLENWIEFQAYHIHTRIKEFERELRLQKEDKDALQKRVDSVDAAVSKEAAEILEYNQRHWKYQERKLEMERYFLQWTEQRRIAMDPGYPTPVEEGCDDRVALPKAVRRASVSNRRKKQPKAHSVLGEPRISKSQIQKRGVRRQKLKAPDTAPKPARPAMDFSPPTSKPDSPGTKPRRPKAQTSRRQPPPRKVSKAKRFDNANAKSVAASRRRANGQKRSSDAQSPQRSQPALVKVTTRGGRVSRPPVEWVPA